MKAKILLVLIIILLLTTSIFVNAKLINTSSNKNFNLKSQDETKKPEWSIGDFWEYKKANFYIGDILLQIVSLEFNIKDMEVKVADVNNNDDTYILDINGNTEEIVYNGASLLEKYKGATAYLNGYAHVQKSTLAMNDFYLHLSVYLLKQEVFNMDFIMDFNNSFDFLNFPINTTNHVPWKSTTDFNLKLIVLGDTLLEIQDQPIEDDLQFVKIDLINGFESLLIKGNLGIISELWYAPQAGYLSEVKEEIILKAEIHGIEVEYARMICNMSINDTNYDPLNVVNRPGIPQIPDGQNDGKANTTYDYKTVTTDPNNDPVYYLFDWGDNTNSGWLGPYNSGEEITASHKWANKGRYEIKVKAKDDTGLKTAWSEPLNISVARSKQKSIFPLSKIFINYPIILMLLQKIFL